MGTVFKNTIFTSISKYCVNSYHFIQMKTKLSFIKVEISLRGEQLAIKIHCYSQMSILSDNSKRR